jgi:flagellar biosynthesis GTPase FlhF
VSTAIGDLIFYAGYYASYVAGIIVAAETWFLEIILTINTRIVASPVVAFGYPVTLNLANVMFVVAIIVIAIMTILRSQTYGVKQTLWKLVVMAILVNFGLVIAGTLISVADGFTGYFLSSIGPNAATGGYADFAARFGGAFQPQRTLLIKNDPAASAGNLDQLRGSFAPSGKSADNLIGPITGVFFALFSLLAIIITLGVLLVMLVVRYVYLGILLILLPIAWACWIFPSLKNQFDRWWDKFIKQVLFAPIVLFFLYIGVQVSDIMSKSKNTGGDFDIAKYTASTTGPWGVITKALGTVITDLVQNFAQVAILVGIMLGGLIAAESMSIKFAGAGVGAFNSAAKGFGSYVGRRTGGTLARRATTAPPQAKTRAGQFLQKVSPMNLVRKATIGNNRVANLAQRRGWTASLQQYGKKTDFSEPKRLWAEAKKHEGEKNAAIRERDKNKNQATQYKNANKPRIDQLQTEMEKTRADAAESRRKEKEAKENNRDPPEIQQHAKEASENEVAAERAEVELKKLQKPLEDFEKAAEEFAAKAETSLKAENGAKAKTWEHYSTNRGVAGSIWFGGLKGAGLWDKSKLKLTKEQLAELAKISGVKGDMSAASSAPPSALPPPAAPAGGTGTP